MAGLSEFVQAVHLELLVIQEQIKTQYDKLVMREREICKREETVTRQMKAIKEMEELLNKRQKKLEERETKAQNQLNNYKISHEKKVSDLISKNDELTNEITSLRSQLSENIEEKKKTAKTKNESRKSSLLLESNNNLMNLTMHWLIKLQLYLTKHFPYDNTLKMDTITMSCEVLPALTSHMTNDHMTTMHDLSKKLTFLEFAHLNASIIIEEEQRGLVATSLRRLGETVDKMIPSGNCQVDILCTLIGLQTITRVDRLVSLLDQLLINLRDTKVSELFVMYQGVVTILRLDKPTVLCTRVMDILLLLTSDIEYMERYVSKGCLTYLLSFIKKPTRTVNGSSDEVNIEKACIILQRLSKNRSLCSLMVNLGSVPTIKSSLCQHTSNSFIILNLKSVLSNINKNKSV